LEALDFVHALVRLLGNEFRCHPWTADTFELSQNFLASLRAELQQADFGIFVFHPDDEISIRGHQLTATRDNTLIEYGMYLGHLGPERTIAVVPVTGAQRTPTDLAGIAVASYDPADITDLNGDLSPLNKAAADIRAHIKKNHAVVTGESEVRVGDERSRLAVAGALGRIPVESVIEDGWAFLLSRGLLVEVQGDAQLKLGLVLVHGVFGPGRVVGFDPPGAHRTLTLEFLSGQGIYPLGQGHVFWLPTR
jgi:hypothetical protein